MKSTAWPSEWGRGTTHCARALANTHLLVHIMRNCYKSTSCFQNCWFFLTLSYSYQREPPHPKCDLTPAFLSFATHSGKNPIWRRNDSFILTKKCYVYTASKAVQHAGLFRLPKITGIRFQNGNVSQSRFASTSEKSRLEMRYFGILPNKWHLSKWLQRNGMMSQMDRVKSKQGQRWLANLSLFAVETNTEKETWDWHDAGAHCAQSTCSEITICNIAICLEIYQVIWSISWHCT